MFALKVYTSAMTIVLVSVLGSVLYAGWLLSHS